MNKTMKIFPALALFAVFSAFSAQAVPVDPSYSGIDEKKIEDITKMVAPSVVKVEARNGTRKVATGVVIDREGFIVTTALISPRDEEIYVITADGKRIKAEFKGLDTFTQIALIQAQDKGLTPIKTGKSGNLQPGAWIGVVGLSPENTPSVTQGIVSSIAQDLRLNVWVVPGSSGSAVVDKEGLMIGLLRGVYTDEQPLVFEFREKEAVASGYVLSRAEAPAAGMAKATPIDVVNSVAADLKKSGKVERGWLGVSVGEKEFRVEIVTVEPKSPAELAKLKEGDIILSIERKDITSGQALSQEIRSRKPGQDITVRIERDGKPLDIKVKLGEYSEEEAKRELTLRFPRLFPPTTPAVPYTPKSTKPGQAPQPRILERFAWESRKYIGVMLQELNKDLSAYFGIKEGVGLLVTEVADDSPAKKAGLKVGDVIVKADGKRAETVSDLSEMIQDKKKGDKIKIELVRDKKTLALDVEIAEEERGSDLLLKESQDYALKFQDQLRKYNEQYRLQMDEFEEKSEESLRKLYEGLSIGMGIKGRLLSEKGTSLAKSFRTIYKI
jgi:S1-C subfamily serine protease